MSQGYCTHTHTGACTALSATAVLTRVRPKRDRLICWLHSYTRAAHATPTSPIDGGDSTHIHTQRTQHTRKHRSSNACASFCDQALAHWLWSVGPAAAIKAFEFVSGVCMLSWPVGAAALCGMGGVISVFRCVGTFIDDRRQRQREYTHAPCDAMTCARAPGCAEVLDDLKSGTRAMLNADARDGAYRTDARAHTHTHTHPTTP